MPDYRVRYRSSEKNTYRAHTSIAPYTTSENARLAKNDNEQVLDGASLSSMPMSLTYFNSEDYKKTAQSNYLTGTFVSLSGLTPYRISYRDPERNPIKEVETDVGSVYDKLSDTSSEEKDVRVQRDNVPTHYTGDISIQADDDVFSYMESLVSKPSLVNKNPSSVTKEDTVTYGSKLTYGGQAADPITGSMNNKDPNKEAREGSRIPYMVIEESRTGTVAQNGTFSEHEGTFKEADLVRVIVLQGVDNFSFGTAQQFDQIEPRGSQTPMRFYNHNPGRTLSFVAKFHQQEYPLEPLLSIAEKAQYLARPYRHTDYALIPKLVKVNIPGRVFRGYISNVSVTYNGDDYSSWSDMNLNRENAGLLAKGNEDFYGGYMLQELDNVTNSNERVDVNTGYVAYGLGSMTIDFQILIVEEIKLTNYTTHTELIEQKEIDKVRTEQAENDAEINGIKATISLATGITDESQLNEMIYVDLYGKPIGYKYTDKDGNAVEKGLINVEDLNVLTYSEYLQILEFEKGQPNIQTEGTSIVQTVQPSTDKMFESFEYLDRTKMEDFCKDHYIKKNPTSTKEEQKAYEEKLKGMSYEEVYSEYKIALQEELGNEDMVYFIESCTGSYLTPQGLMTDSICDPLIKSFLKEPMDTFAQAFSVLKLVVPDTEIDFEDYSSIIISTTDKSLLAEICWGYGLGFGLSRNKKHFIYPVTSIHSYMTYASNWYPDDLEEKYIKVYKAWVIKYNDGYVDDGGGNKYNTLSLEHLLSLSSTVCEDLKIFNDEEGRPLSNPDDYLYNQILGELRQLRDSFLKGFRLCTADILPPNGVLLPNKRTCEAYKKEHKDSKPYYWEVDVNH